MRARTAARPAAPVGRHRRPVPSRRLHRSLAALPAAVAMLAMLACTGVVGSAPDASAAVPISGAFAQGGPSGETAFGTWRAAPIGLAHAFAPKSTWSDIELPSTFVSYWSKSIYRTKLMISYPMLPTNVSASMSAGASGSYDAHFKTAATKLVAAGMGNAIIRLGWELNGTWFKWSAKPNPAAYAAYYRHIVNAMRSVPGQSFQFIWSVSNNYYGWDPRTAWPGNSYVTYVGVGLYDAWWNHGSATPAQRWNYLLNLNGSNVQGGLNFWTSYAASVGKPVVFPEWGVVNKDAAMAGGGGGGDDPYFINQMHSWVGSHNVAWETYFDADASDGYHRLDTTRFPNAAKAYRQDFGGL
jgi:hypothetical protein